MQEVYKILFIIVSSLLGIGVIGYLGYLFHSKVYYPKHFEINHYKIVNKIVKEFDYRLINNFIFQIGENKVAKIDHIIFGEKYIYLIFSRYYEGDIEGKIEDKDLQFVPKKGARLYTINQYSFMKSMIEKIHLNTLVQKNAFIGIVMTNNDCNNYVIGQSDNLFIVKKKELRKAIKGIESRQVGKLKEEFLQDAILAFSRRNKRKDG